MRLGRGVAPWLIPASALYAGLMRLRNAWYDAAPFASHDAGIPVICVGNITTGGSGKTPLVMEIVRGLSAAGRTPAILTRGYRGRADEPADEVLEYRSALPDVPVVVNPDRVKGAATARLEHDADCIVMDDGFQHRRLRRDLDIVVIDALNPWGGGWTLPAGRLREPLTGLRRAGLIVINRVNLADDAAADAIEARLDALPVESPRLRASVAVDRIVEDRVSLPTERLKDRRVQPVSGLGNPAAFHRLLNATGAELLPPMVYGDHHRYSAADVNDVRSAARAAGAEAVVTTRKDWVKLGRLFEPGDGPPLWRVDIRVELDEPGVLERALERALAVD